MVNTKSMTHPEEQAKANANIAELTQRLNMAFPDCFALKEEVDEKKEMDAMVVVIQRNWPKLEASSEVVEDAKTKLSHAISMANATEM